MRHQSESISILFCTTKSQPHVEINFFRSISFFGSEWFDASNGNEQTTDYHNLCPGPKRKMKKQLEVHRCACVRTFVRNPCRVVDQTASKRQKPNNRIYFIFFFLNLIYQNMVHGGTLYASILNSMEVIPQLYTNRNFSIIMFSRSSISMRARLFQYVHKHMKSPFSVSIYGPMMNRSIFSLQISRHTFHVYIQFSVCGLTHDALCSRFCKFDRHK